MIDPPPSASADAGALAARFRGSRDPDLLGSRCLPWEGALTALRFGGRVGEACISDGVPW